MSSPQSNGKPKFAMYWAAACGGCEIAVLNIHEKILDVDANFEVVFWPVAMDAKYKDVEAMPDGSILLTLFNGAIRNSENEHMAHVLRRKSKILVAFGSCANEGCMPALANLSSREELFDTVYQTPSTVNPDDIRPQPLWQAPEGELTIPEFYPVVRTLDQVVPVDYHIPGCPPESHQIGAVIDLVIQVLQGKAELPPAGSVIGAGQSTVCDECTRQRNIKHIKKFVRIQETQIDPQLCLLGIGENGHLAFNDPAVADFDDSQVVKVVELDEACRRQQVNDGCFPTIADVPRQALSLTVPVFRRARRLSVHVPGARKAEAVRATLRDEISTACPASILRTHPGATLYLDPAAAGKL